MKALVADDHPMVRDALGLALQRGEPTIEIFEAGDFATAFGICERLVPDLALLDLNMPGTNGIDGIRRLREAFPALSMIVASGQEDPPTMRAVLATGVHGFFPKSSPPALLLQAVQLVRAGGVYVPQGVLADMAAGAPPPTTSGLTPRQLDVLKRLLKGWPNKAIARELSLTEGTVKLHIAAILRTLQARNRTEAVVRARELGLDTTF